MKEGCPIVDKRDGLGVWLRLLGLENPVPFQEEVARARPGLRAQVLLFCYICLPMCMSHIIKKKYADFKNTYP